MLSWPAAAALALLPLGCDAPGVETVLEPYLPSSAHQAYGHALAQAGLTRTALGGDWLAAAAAAMREPAAVSLPLEASGQVEPGEATASAYGFTVPAGQRLVISLQVSSEEGLELFADLFRRGQSGSLEHVASAAPGAAAAGERWERTIEIEVLQRASYVLRIQPELLRRGSYRLQIRGGALLAFPVDGLDLRAIRSFFGAERDGGVRRHRGVDIFAERGTPALAAMDGWVTRVDTTPRGGHVVWLQALFSDLRLYYAHLSSQQVRAGQFVAAGDVVGTVGNTGNAITTPPHLHFGVYLRRRGPRDPYLFLR